MIKIDLLGDCYVRFGRGSFFYRLIHQDFSCWERFPPSKELKRMKSLDYANLKIEGIHNCQFWLLEEESWSKALFHSPQCISLVFLSLSSDANHKKAYEAVKNEMKVCNTVYLIGCVDTPEDITDGWLVETHKRKAELHGVPFWLYCCKTANGMREFIAQVANDNIAIEQDTEVFKQVRKTMAGVFMAKEDIVPKKSGDLALTANTLVKVTAAGKFGWFYGAADGKEGWFNTRGGMITEIDSKLGQVEQAILLKAMNKGCFSVEISKVLCIGPPGVGKTCLKHLMLNLPPPERRTSTPLACRATRAIQSCVIDTGEEATVWKEVDSIDFLADRISTIPQVLAAKREFLSNQPNPQAMHVSDNNSLDLRQQSAKFENDQSSVISPESVREVTQEVWHRNISSIPPTTEQPQVFKSVYFIDSGGQPQFLDILPAFIRCNTVNMVVTNLSTSFSSRPIFEYVIDDQHMCQPKELQQTNLELIESTVRSLASVRYTKNDILESSPSNPRFMVLGTFADKLEGLGWLWRQSVAQKDAQLRRMLGGLSEMCICCNEQTKEIIFPVNTLTTSNRRSIGSQLTSKIMNTPGVAMKAEIPSQWYFLEQEMQKKAKQLKRGILTLQECHEIGMNLNLPENEVEAAIKYLSLLTIFQYFPDILPNVVFVEPQCILNNLSQLISFSFTTLGQQHSRLPSGAYTKLHQEGLFDPSLLCCLKESFIPGIFTEEDFVRVLQKNFVVSVIEERLFFIPCVLPRVVMKHSRKMRYAKNLDPILLISECKVNPQGLFPAMVVSLLQNKRGTSRCVLHSNDESSQTQFRNAITLSCTELGGALLLVDSFKQIEVYYSGHRDSAPLILEQLHSAISEVISQFSYDPEVMRFSEGVWCPFHVPWFWQEPSHPARISQLASGKLLVTCTTNPDQCKEVTSVRHRAWFHSNNHSQQPSMIDLHDYVAAKIPERWKIVGRALKIDDAVLNAFDAERVADPEERMMRVFDRWIRKQTLRPISWSTIAAVLSSPTVREETLANNITSRFL